MNYATLLTKLNNIKSIEELEPIKALIREEIMLSDTTTIGGKNRVKKALTILKDNAKVREILGFTSTYRDYQCFTGEKASWLVALKGEDKINELTEYNETEHKLGQYPNLSYIIESTKLDMSINYNASYLLNLSKCNDKIELDLRNNYKVVFSSKVIKDVLTMLNATSSSEVVIEYVEKSPYGSHYVSIATRIRVDNKDSFAMVCPLKVYDKGE